MATARCSSISFLSSLPQCFTSLRSVLANCFTSNKKPPNKEIFRKALDEEERSSSDFGSRDSTNNILLRVDNSVIQDPENKNSNDQQQDITYNAPVRQNSEVDGNIEIQSIHVQNAGDEEMSELAKSDTGEFNKFIIPGESDAIYEPKLLTPIRLADPEFETTSLKYTPIYDQNFLEGVLFPTPIQVMEESSVVHRSIPRVLEVKLKDSDSSSPESESSFGPIQNNNTPTFPKIEGLECLSAGVSTENSDYSLSPRHTRASSWGPDASPLIQPNFASQNDPWGSELDPRQPATNDCSLRIFKEAGYNNPNDPANKGKVGRLNKHRPIESADMHNAYGLGDRETQPQPKPNPMTEDEIREIGRKNMDMRKADKGFFGMFSVENFNDFFAAMENEKDPKSFFDKLSEYVGAISDKIIPSATPAPNAGIRVSGSRRR